MLNDGRTLVPVPIIVARDTSTAQHPEFKVLQERLPADDVMEIAGVRVTSPVRATFDALRLAPDLEEAVVVVDAMLAAGLITRPELAAYAEGWHRHRGRKKAQMALALAREGVRSPNETRVRMIWVRDTGLPEPLVNRVVYGPRKERIGEVDLLEPESGLMVEFDGADHRTRGQHRHDVYRDEACADAGLTVARVTGQDLRSRTLAAQRLEAAYRRARDMPSSRHRWRLG